MNIFQKTYINLINEWNQNLILQSLNSDILQNQKIPEQFKQKLINIPDPKQKKMILHFVSKNYQINEKNLGTLKQAFADLNRFKLNYQQFNTPEQMMNSVSVRKQKNNKSYGPQSFPNVITHKVDQGQGITTYWVEDSPKGQMAVRKIIDSQLGYDRNFWCLETRNGTAKKRWGNQINDLTDQQKTKLGFNDLDDSLSIAYNFWKKHSSYPKRVAFQNGKIYAFSANSGDEILWWNLDDKHFDYFPNHQNLKDKDIQYYKNLPITFKLCSNMNLSEEQIRKLADDNNCDIRCRIAGRDDLPEDVIRKLANDKRQRVRQRIAGRDDLPEDLIRKLANDEDQMVRSNIARRKDLPEDLIRKLANDESYSVRQRIAGRDDLPEDVIRKLANDKDKFVRKYIAERKDLPEDLIRQLADDNHQLVRNSIIERNDLSEDLIRKLANDEDLMIRSSIAKRDDLPEDLIRKLVDDKSQSVKKCIAGRKDLPEDLIRKLVNDEDLYIRLEIAKRNNLPKDLIKKLANDKNQKVRNTIKQRYKI